MNNLGNYFLIPDSLEYVAYCFDIRFLFYRFVGIFLFFFQLLLVQAVRPDRLQSAMTCFASQTLGKCFILLLCVLFIFAVHLNIHKK